MSNMNTKPTTQKIFTMMRLISMNWMVYQKILRLFQISIRRKFKKNEYAEEVNDTQVIQMDNNKEDIILDYDEENKYDTIDE